MQVLVTGANGFLGKHIVSKLKNETCDVIAFVRESGVTTGLEKSGARLVYGDLRDEDKVSEALKNVDVVVHAAATMRGGWEEYKHVNVDAMELLLEKACKAKVKRFVFISSIIVYDHTNANPGTVFSEDMSYEEINLTNYSRSKIEAEKVVARFESEKKISTVILRPGALYGGAGPIYPARLGFSGGSAYILIGDGSVKIPLSHVDSVSDAVYSCLESKDVSGKVYNVIEDGEINQNDYLELVRKHAIPKLKKIKLAYKAALFLASSMQKTLGLVGQSSPIRIPYLRLCSTQFYYSNKCIKEELGWQPQKDFTGSITDTLEVFAENKKPVRRSPIEKGRVIVPSDKILKVGMVGSGMFADTHLSILKKFKNAQIEALCDPNETARKELTDKYAIPGSYPDIDSMLAGSKIDVVHIVTPAQTHLELALKAMEHGCHVLMEKPVGVNTQEARKMVQAAKKHGVKFTVDHNHVFDEVMIKARDIIGSGQLGRIAYVDSWYATSYSSNSNNRYLKYDAKDHWVYNLPGSLYQNMISHPISLLIDVMGQVTDMSSSDKYLHIVPHMKSDELRVMVENETTIGMINMSLTVSPRYHYVNVYGTNATLKIDFLNKYLFLDKSIPMVPKIIGRNISLLKQASAILFAMLRNGFNIVRKRYSLFEGNERLIHLFYRSILMDEEVPISSAEAIHSMEIMDQIWKQIKSSSWRAAEKSSNGAVKKPRPRKRTTRTAAAS